MTQGSKYASAKKNGTTIYTEAQFEGFMKKRLKNEEFTLSVRKSLNMGGMEESKVEELPEKSRDEVGNEMWTEVYAPRSV